MSIEGARIHLDTLGLRGPCVNWTCADVTSCSDTDVLLDLDDALSIIWNHSVVRLGCGLFIIALRWAEYWCRTRRDARRAAKSLAHATSSRGALRRSHEPQNESESRIANTEFLSPNTWKDAAHAATRAATRAVHSKNWLELLLDMYVVYFYRVVVPLWLVFLYLWVGARTMSVLESPTEVAAHNEYVVLMACLRNHTEPDV